MYDIIGDIHGHADELVELLERLDYKSTNGVFRHPRRTAVFCGDFIDRGPQIPDVVAIARGMVQNNAALAVMGNHEFNALAYHTADPSAPGTYFRRHSTRNEQQHAATLQQFSEDDLQQALQWFGSLPVALDLQSCRIVHACWDTTAIRQLEALRQSAGSAYSPEFLKHTARSGTSEFEAVERVLKGPELPLPDGVSVTDKEGNVRHRIRIRWFEPAADQTWRSYALPRKSALPDAPVPVDAPAVPYPKEAPPVFVGHYWLPESVARPLAPNIACLDYSIARDGFLTAYRFDGETSLHSERFVAVPSRTRKNA